MLFFCNKGFIWICISFFLKVFLVVLGYSWYVMVFSYWSEGRVIVVRLMNVNCIYIFGDFYFVGSELIVIYMVVVIIFLYDINIVIIIIYVIGCKVVVVVVDSDV